MLFPCYCVALADFLLGLARFFFFSCWSLAGSLFFLVGLLFLEVLAVERDVSEQLEQGHPSHRCPRLFRSTSELCRCLPRPFGCQPSMRLLVQGELWPCCTTHGLESRLLIRWSVSADLTSYVSV